MNEYKVRVTEAWVRNRVVTVTAMNALDAEYAALTAYAGPVDLNTDEGAREVEFGRMADELEFVMDLDADVLTDEEVNA